MAQGRSLLLRLTGDPTDAKRAIREITDGLTQFARQKAEATVDVATGRAQQKIAETQAALKRLEADKVNARIDIKTEAVKVQIAQVQARLERLGRQEASPKVTLATGRALEQLERLEHKLAKMDRERVNVDIDVGRGGGELATSALTAGLELLVSAAGSAVGGIGALGGAVRSLGPFLLGAAIIIGTLLAPALLLLASSLANAVIGAGALAVAFGALAGPVVLTAIAVLTRFAAILQAVKERQDQSSQQNAAVAAAQDQVRNATDALASAQDNLRNQTTAAYQAWRDAIEAVSDSLRDIQHAQLGIDEANLGLREAQQALRDFRKESGTAAGSLDGLFRKFTDVSIDFDSGIFEKALARSGETLSGDDELRLERLILNVRQARLREKDAVDQLSDSERKLKQDRKTEAEFVRDGIAAYEPYQAAVQGVRDATRQHAAAIRSANQALERQGKLWDDLSPAEQRFARRLERFQDAFRKAFGPATGSILRGFGRALDAIADALNKPGIRASLAFLGGAIGSFFRGIAREIRRKEFQEGFERFTRTAGRLIRTLGTSAIRNFLRLTLRIAEEALPPLEAGLRRVVRWFDRFVDAASKASTRNRGFGRADDMPTKSPIERFIDRAIDSFKTWAGIIKDLGRILGGFFKAMLPDGDKLADSFARTVNKFADWVNSKKGQRSLRDFFSDLRRIVSDMADKLAAAAKTTKDMVEDLKKMGPLDLVKKGFEKSFAGNLLDLLKIPGIFRASGGIIPGAGRGDIVPAMLEPGEFVIRRAMVERLGAPFFAALNGGMGFAAGGLVPAPAGGGGVHVHGDIRVQAPAAQVPDGRAAAVLIARELERRGG